MHSQVACILYPPPHAGSLTVSLIYGEDKDLKWFILWGPVEFVVLILSLKWLLDIHMAMVPVQLDSEVRAQQSIQSWRHAYWSWKTAVAINDIILDQGF